MDRCPRQLMSTKPSAWPVHDVMMFKGLTSAKLLDFILYADRFLLQDMSYRDSVRMYCNTTWTRMKEFKRRIWSFCRTCSRMTQPNKNNEHNQISYSHRLLKNRPMSRLMDLFFLLSCLYALKTCDRVSEPTSLSSFAILRALIQTDTGISVHSLRPWGTCLNQVTNKHLAQTAQHDVHLLIIQRLINQAGHQLQKSEHERCT